MMDPTNPYTVGYYDTYDGPQATGPVGAGIAGGANGAWGSTVRNADGLIVISDMMTGFWAFKMDGFDGWNGHQWGMPNISARRTGTTGQRVRRSRRASARKRNIQHRTPNPESRRLARLHDSMFDVEYSGTAGPL